MGGNAAHGEVLLSSCGFSLKKEEKKSDRDLFLEGRRLLFSFLPSFQKSGFLAALDLLRKPAPFAFSSLLRPLVRRGLFPLPCRLSAADIPVFPLRAPQVM